MMTNTDNNVLPAGMGGATRSAIAPVAVATGQETHGTGASSNRDTTVFASLRQSGVTAETQREQAPVDTAETMEALADALNRSFGEKQSLQFSVDQDTGVSVIKVTQTGSGELIRQIPNEEALHIMQKLNQRLDSGNDTAVLFDQMA